MPKKPNAKKIAARAYGNEKALAAAENGEYLIARVVKALGNCGFSAEIDTGRGVRTVQVLVRGKFKCGTNGATRVEPGVFVACDGVLEEVASRQKNLEVVAVVNKQRALDRLRDKGRVSERAVRGADDGVEDLFDRGEEETAPRDLWAKRDDEREELAEEILARYRRRAEGAKGRVEVDLVRGKKQEDDAEEKPDDDEFDLEEAAGGGGGAKKERVAGALNRKERREAERLAAEAAAAASGDVAAADDLAALYRAHAEEEQYEFDARAAAAFKARVSTKTWEEEADEIDIDAI